MNQARRSTGWLPQTFRVAIRRGHHTQWNPDGRERTTASTNHRLRVLAGALTCTLAAGCSAEVDAGTGSASSPAPTWTEVTQGFRVEHRVALPGTSYERDLAALSGDVLWIAVEATDGTASLARVDTKQRALLDAPPIPLEKKAFQVRALPSGIWVSTGAEPGPGEIQRLDPVTGDELGSWPLLTTLPHGLVEGAGAVWVGNTEGEQPGTVTRIDLVSGKAEDVATGGHMAWKLALWQDSLVVAHHRPDEYGKEPSQPSVVVLDWDGVEQARYSVGDSESDCCGLSGLAVDEDTIWTSSYAGATINRIDPGTGDVTTGILPFSSEGRLIHAGSFLYQDTVDAQYRDGVVKVDDQTMDVVGFAETDGQTVDMAVVGDDIWVSTSNGLVRLSAASLQTVGQSDLGVGWVIPASDGVWVAHGDEAILAQP